MAIKQKNKSKEIQHLLSIKDMDLKTIEDIFLSADKYLQNKNINKYEILKGKTVCNLFFENSTRTQTTFENNDSLTKDIKYFYTFLLSFSINSIIDR